MTARRWLTEASQAIKPDKRFRQGGSRSRRASTGGGCRGPRLLKHRRAAGRAQFFELRIGVLFLVETRIPNQTAWQGGLRQFCRHEFQEPSDEDSPTNQQDVRKRSFAGVAEDLRQPWAERRWQRKGRGFGRRRATLAPSNEATVERMARHVLSKFLLTTP